MGKKRQRDFSKKHLLEKLEIILSILDEIEHSEDEEESIVASFIELKKSKITYEKILNKLKYIRLNQAVEELQNGLIVTFNSSSQMEFYHSYSFNINGETFTKPLLTQTQTVARETVLNRDIELLKRMKDEAIERKRSEIASFMELVRANPYLKPDEVTHLIKRMPPEDGLMEVELPIEIIKRIVGGEYDIKPKKRSLIFSKGERYKLYGRELNYQVRITYNRREIYSLIWQGEELGVVEDFYLKMHELKRNFQNRVYQLKAKLKGLSQGLEVDNEEIKTHILKFVEPRVKSSNSLELSKRLKEKIVYEFSLHINRLRDRKKKEELLAKTIRDFKLLFPLARSLEREIVFHMGATNSGKTYQALEELKGAETGYYLAPLRLLALEGYENLKKGGVNVSLITGEEEIIDEDSTHISSTIEMMNSSVEVDIAVIDEVQMIEDRDRGWAWVNALIGVPAKRVILTGSSNALKAVTELCKYLNEPLQVIEFQRKNELKLLKTPTSIKSIEKSTAIVAFSRRDVLSLRHELSKNYQVSVVYGNLSPEVRREEARRFREGESDILVATDAIAMGLNLPIKTLLFSTANKFDGLRQRDLKTSEILQISGRAGRYGLKEVGYIGALDRRTLKIVTSKFYKSLPDIQLPLFVMASLEHIMLIGEILETSELTDILEFFANNMEFDGPFLAGNIDSMLEIAEIVDSYELDLKTKYYLASAPASISSPYIEGVFRHYIESLEEDSIINYYPPKKLPKLAQTNEMMLEAEDRVREISLYLWLSFKFPNHFPDTQKAVQARGKLNKFIEMSLKEGELIKQCRRCGKRLDFTYRYSICEECYFKGRRFRYY